MSAATTPAVPTLGAHDDIAGLGKALWKRKFWIIIPTLLAFFGSIAIVNMLPTRYAGEARVLLENRETVYSRPDRDSRTDPAIDPEAVASQVQIVMSKDLALKVIRDLKLAERDEFDPLSKGLGVIDLVGMVTGLMPDPRSIPREERVLRTYYKRLLVFPQGKSRVIQIEFQSEDPKVAADVANRIAEEYLSREERAKRDTSRVTSDWLDKAIEPLMKKVVEAESKVEAFRAQRGLFVGANNISITTQQLTEMNSQLATARTQQADLTSRAKLIREAIRLGRVFETSEVNNNDLVRRLLEQRAALKAQIAFDERTLLPGHPRMQELRSQLADLEQQVRAAAERAARALENDARVAGARLQSLQTEMTSQKKSAALSNEDEVQLKALEREATALREQLNSYRNKFLDAAARTSDSTAPADARIISRAFAQNDPAFPKRLPIVLLATIGTLVITSAMVASLHLMARASAMAYPEYAGYAGSYPVPAYGHDGEPLPPSPDGPPPGTRSKPGLLASFMRSALPGRSRKEPRDVPAANDVGHPFAMPARAGMLSDEAALSVRSRAANAIADEIATELAIMGYLGRGKILMLHGMGREPRTALHAMRLGRRLSQDGAAVVLDLSGTNELYPRVVGAEADGLAAYLGGEGEITDIIHRDPRSRLHLVPAGEPIAQILSGPEARAAMYSLVEALSQAYAFVVVDAGPVGSAAEAFSDLADAFALIAPADISEAHLETAAEKLETLRGAPVFIVEEEASQSFEPPPGEGRRRMAFG
ncbi:MAG: lipopolysaccharide biosynthesis protein [Rhizobiales bacterium]|nr:lipopolysaccharide biosynthesis protein [Hyphomicrobiales bacterium]